jgi:hypothetical protein
MRDQYLFGRSTFWALLLACAMAAASGLSLTVARLGPTPSDVCSGFCTSCNNGSNGCSCPSGVNSCVPATYRPGGY